VEIVRLNRPKPTARGANFRSAAWDSDAVRDSAPAPAEVASATGGAAVAVVVAVAVSAAVDLNLESA